MKIKRNAALRDRNLRVVAHDASPRSAVPAREMRGRRRGEGFATPALVLAIIVAIGAIGAYPAGSESVSEPDERVDTADSAKDQRPIPESKQMRIQRARSGAGGPPGLDSLLQLPSGYVGDRAPIVAGASEMEWRRRFKKTRETLSEARLELEKTKRELDEVAQTGGATQWSVSAPGGGGGGGVDGPSQSSSPLSYKLRGALKQNRWDLEEAEKAMRDLSIEADLAGVPKGWRGQGDAADRTPSEVGQLLD